MANEQLPEEEPRDRIRWLWIGIGVIVVAMVLFLWFRGGIESDVSLVRVRHILISFDASDPVERASALDQITELKRRINNGESFSKLAREYSSDEYSARRGGDLGYRPKGEFVPSFEEFVWEGKVGSVSDVIQSQYGFHLVKIEDRYVSEIDRLERERERRVRDQGAAATERESP